MAQSREPIIPLQNFNRGGLSDSKWSGARDSYYKMTGWDLHSTPGLLKVAQKLSLESPEEVDEFCKNRVTSTNGMVYWFSSESGKIWQRDSMGIYTLVYTIVPTSGEAKILGAFEYQGKIFFATEEYLHYIDATLALGVTQWTANVSANWQKFTNGDPDFHPMMEQNLVMYIGDGNLLAQVDVNTFSAAALDIKNPLRIKSLGKVYTDVLIGTYVSDYVTKTELIRWNTWSGSFQVSNPVNEAGINAFIQGDNIILVQAGVTGRLYYFDSNFNTLRSFKTIPGEYGPTKYGTVYPEAVANLNNIVLFGFSNGAGNPSDQGVYQVGRYSSSYPYVLDLPFPISLRDEDEDFVLSNLEIGAIAVRGFDIFVSWRYDTGEIVDSVHIYRTGIDKIDYTQKLNGAYFETRLLLSPNRLSLANYAGAYMAYASLPDDCAIDMFIAKNYGEYEEVEDIRPDAMRNLVRAENLGIEATVLQMKIKVVTEGNTAPEIESGALILR